MPHEVSNITGLGKQMVEEIGGIPGGFNAGVFEQYWTALLSSGLGIILISEKAGNPVGAIGGVIGPDFNNGMVCFSETFFFVNKDGKGDGVKLLLSIEKELKEIGVKLIYTNSLYDTSGEDRVSKLYEKTGYRKYGFSHTKEL